MRPAAVPSNPAFSWGQHAVCNLRAAFLKTCPFPPALLPLTGAVDDYLRGIGFYHRLFQRASADLGLEEAAAEGAAAQQAAAAQE